MMNMCKWLIVAVCGGFLACGCAPVKAPPPSLSCKNLPANAKEQALAVQQALSGLGYQVGPQDGKMNGNTLEVLRTFQQDMGLPANGRTDAQTLEALGFCVSNDGSMDFPADRRRQLQTAQRLLAEQGYDPGPADGQMGNKTREALKQFQADRGLSQTGKVDAATRAALTGSQTAKAVEAPNVRQVVGKQKAPQGELSPQKKASIEAEIRKRQSLPTSAVFSWRYYDDHSGARITVDTPTKYGSSSGVLREEWNLVINRDNSHSLLGPYNRVNLSISFLDICKTGNYGQIKAAIDNDANVHTKDTNGDTMLHIAARKNLGPEIVKLLLHAPGVSCTLPGEAEQSVNIYKKNNGNKESIKILDKYVSDCTAEPDGDGH